MKKVGGDSLRNFFWKCPELLVSAMLSLAVLSCCHLSSAQAALCTPYPPGQYHPSLQVDSLGNPHVAWEQILDNGQDPDGNQCWQNDVFYTRSNDQGNTFLPATSEIDRILTTQYRVSLALDSDGNPAVAWVDTRENINYIYFSRSYDGGETFSPGIRVDSSSEPQDRPFLLLDFSGNPVIAWVKVYYEAPHMNPVGHIYVTRSTDGGSTFLPSVCVFRSPIPAQGWPSLAIDSQNNPLIVCHYWRSKIKRWNIFFSKSTDQGRSFLRPVMVEDSFSHQVAAGKSILAVDSDDNPCVVFTDNRSGNWNIYFARSVNKGLSFQPSAAIESSPGFQQMPAIKITSNNDTYVVWVDNRTGRRNIRFTVSKDGGVTFRKSIPIDPQPAAQKRPSLDVELNVPHIMWIDERQGIPYVYHTKSVDNGASFLPGKSVYEFPVAP